MSGIRKVSDRALQFLFFLRDRKPPARARQKYVRESKPYLIAHTRMAPLSHPQAVSVRDSLMAQKQCTTIANPRRARHLVRDGQQSQGASRYEEKSYEGLR